MKAFVCLAAVALAWIESQDPKNNAADEVAAAAVKLAEQDNYAWTLRTAGRDVAEVPAGKPKPVLPRIASVEGRCDKAGIVVLKWDQIANAPEVSAMLKGSKVVMKTGDKWKSPAELDGKSDDLAAFFAGVVTHYRTPADDVKDLLKGARGLQKDPDGMYAGDLSEGAAKAQIQRILKGGGSKNPPEITKPMAKVRFWISDGLVSKYEIASEGKVIEKGVAITLNRTLTVQVKEFNAAPVDIPDEAAKKLQ